MLALIPLLLALQFSVAQAQELPPPPTVPAHADPERVETAPPEVAPGVAEVEVPHAEEGAGGDLMHHVLDERKVKAPWGYVYLPDAGSWQVGPVDLTPTKYVVYLWITGLLTLLLILPAAQSAKRTRREGRAPRGGHNAIEAMVLFLREEVVMKNIGHGGERFAPFVITVFFFIAIANILGLVPYGGSVTASISVTATLALMSFVAIEYSGMQALGFKGYMSTIFYWNKDLPVVMRPIMFLILSPVELLGKLAKPFALAVRLMANMSAGKILIYALIGLIFIFGSWWVFWGPLIMTVAITFLKIFVAFLQAFVFALLTSVFIGMIRHAH